MFVKENTNGNLHTKRIQPATSNGFVLSVEVTSGNVSDSVAWDAVYDKSADRFQKSNL